MAEYKVQFEVFEGPLDLLLYLIKKEEVDIYEVNLTKLATQFIAHIDLMREFDLEIAGEFLVMASTLMYIKSRELLPVDQQVVVEGEDEGEDPRWELIRQLVEYKKFKDAAAQLQAREAEQENIFPRLPGKLEFESAAPAPKPDVSIFDLLNAVNGVLQRFKKREGDARDIFEDKWTVSEKIESILKILSERGGVRFAELFESAASRAEVICTFLALLELIRLKQLVCVQSEAFAEIEIRRAENVAAPSAPVDNSTSELIIDYKLSSRWNEKNAGVDLAYASETDLLYYLILGDVILKNSTHDLSAKWEWIPIIDFAAALKLISDELKHNKTETDFEFTESDAKIFFKRQAEKIIISTSYVPGEIQLSFNKFVEAVDKFSKRVATELTEQYPRLTENKEFLKLLPVT